jgi:hypothetical protein
MKKQFIPNEGRPVALYNADKKELIGVFSSAKVADMYLYVTAKGGRGGVVSSYLAQKKRIKNSIFGFPVAVRYANEAQLIVLSGQDSVVMDGYPMPKCRKR